MDIATTRFGTVTIEEVDVMIFSDGLIGMEDCRQWALLADSQNDALGWMQCLDRPEVCARLSGSGGATRRRAAGAQFGRRCAGARDPQPSRGLPGAESQSAARVVHGATDRAANRCQRRSCSAAPDPGRVEIAAGRLVGGCVGQFERRSMKRRMCSKSRRGIIGNFTLGLESRDKPDRPLSQTGTFARRGVLPRQTVDCPDSRIAPVITAAAIRGRRSSGSGAGAIGVTERNLRGDPYGASCLFFLDSATRASSSATMWS
jgi:hypothetical protein